VKRTVKGGKDGKLWRSLEKEKTREDGNSPCWVPQKAISRK